MSTHQRIINFVVVPIMYLISLFCLVNASIFEKLSNLIGSFSRGLIVVNAIVLLILVLVLIGKARVYKYIYLVCAIFQIISVFCYSKLNWFEFLFKLKLESKLPVALAALFAFTTFVSYLLVDNIIIYREKCVDWLIQGAHVVEIKAAKISHRAFLIGIGTIISSLIVIIIFLGFVVFRLDPDQSEPTIMALLGVLIVWIFTWLMVYKSYEKS